MAKKLTINFQPSGRKAPATAGEDLLTVARRSGVDIKSACGGKGSCGKCRVRVDSSADGAGSLTPPTEAEQRLLEANDLADGIRLACQARVQGDIRVFVPEESRRAKHVDAKLTRERTRLLAPAVRVYAISLSGSGSGGPAEPADRLIEALSSEHDLAGLSVEPTALESLSRLDDHPAQDLLALIWQDAEPDVAAEGAITEDDGQEGPVILDVRPAAEPGKILGLALDVGTTTIAAYLADLTTGEVVATASALNPQVTYGDDIIARLQHAAHHPDGARELQQLVMAEVDRLAQHTAREVGADARDIVDMVMVGNTAIHHLFLGLDSGTLRRAPFEPMVKEAVETKASELGLALHPACRLYALPIEAGFVGGDNVAVIIAEEPYRQQDIVLLVDVGTNGELVLGNQDRMLSASCATGPAFEGAHIEHGTRATPGAIERVRINPDTWDVSFKVIGTDQWSHELSPGEVKANGICGSGIIEAAAEMLKAGVILADGGFDPKRTHERLLLDEDRPRKLIIARVEESTTGRPITVSLKDIRAMQLGKAALRAGAEILLARYGAKRPDRVILAGAFGSYIDKHAALAIGMLPDCEPDDVTSVGNAAGDGALLALLDLGKRREAEWAAQSVEYVELAAASDFQAAYIEAMRFEPSGGTS